MCITAASADAGELTQLALERDEWAITLTAEAWRLVQQASCFRLLPMRATCHVRSRSTSAAAAVHVRVRAMARRSRSDGGTPTAARSGLTRRPTGWSASPRDEIGRSPACASVVCDGIRRTARASLPPVLQRMSVMRILATATLIAILASAGSVAAQWWWPFGSDEPTDILLENQRLSSENENLVRERARLSAENESLRQRLNELQIEGAGQAGVARENERLRGELERARIDAAEELARRDQLEDTLDEERRRRIRLEETVRNNRNGRRNDPGSLGWLPFLMLLLLAAVAFWREWWWRSRVLTARRVPVVREGSDALVRPVAGVPSVKTDVQDH